MEFGVLSLGDHLATPEGEKQTQGERLRGLVDAAVRAEELGYDLFGVGEHHFSEYIVSSPLVMLGAIAARTSRIRLTTAVTLMGILDPLRVAEDFNTVDQLSDGRMELVFGRGISTDGYSEFGVDPAQGREILVDKMNLFRRLLASDEPVSFSGAFRPDLQGITVQPRPVQTDPRIWMATGMSEESVRWTAALGMPLMLPTILRPAETWADMVVLYRELMEQNGYGDRSRVGVCTHLHIAETSQQAEREWQPYLTQYVNWARGASGNDEPVDYQGLINGPAVCGSPSKVLERLGSIDEALHPDIHISVLDIGALPAPQVTRQMELFASTVADRLRSRDTVDA